MKLYLDAQDKIIMSRVVGQAQKCSLWFVIQLLGIQTQNMIN